MVLLKRAKGLIKKTYQRFINSLIYKLSKSELKNEKLQKELRKVNEENLIKERKYIDELNIRKTEIRYIDLQMARVTKYINSFRFQNDSKEEIKEHLIELIKGNTLD